MPVSISTSLYYRVDGPPSAPPLLLLHGGPGAHHDYLYPQMLDLAKDHRVYTYDQRGGGQSRTDDPTPITWHTQVADLDALISEFELKPPTIIGYSWGALLAMLYAVESTRNTSLAQPARMVLISPAPVTKFWRNQFEATLAARSKGPAIEAMRAQLSQSGLKESDPAAFKQRSFELAVAGYFHDPHKATSLTPFRVTGKVQQSIWHSLGDYDIRQALCAVRCPVLVVHGDSDPIPLESAKAAADSLSGSFCGNGGGNENGNGDQDRGREVGERARGPIRFVELPACGHVPYVEQPELLFKSIRSFLAETEAA